MSSSTSPQNPTEPAFAGLSTDDPWNAAWRKAGVAEVSVDWLKENRRSVRLVDVREPREFNAELGHIDGAELVPLATILEAASAWDRAEPLAIICRSGRRSANAAGSLERLGFERVASVAGGMIAWRG